MLSIIFHCDGLMLWWNPNHTSLPLPRTYGSPSGGAKNERPTGVYLCVCVCVYMCVYVYERERERESERVQILPHGGKMSHDYIQCLYSIERHYKIISTKHSLQLF